MATRLFIFMTFPVIFNCGISWGGAIILHAILNAVASLILARAPYHFRTGLVGLSFLSGLIGVTLSTLYTGQLGDLFLIRMWRNGRIFEPEHRQWLNISCIILLTASLILWGVGAVKIVFARLSEELGTLVDSVIDLLKGIWDALNTACDAVSAAASTTVDVIKALLSSSANAVTLSSSKSGLSGSVTGQGLMDGAIRLGQEDPEGFLNFFVIVYGQYRKGLPDHGHQNPLQV